MIFVVILFLHYSVNSSAKVRNLFKATKLLPAISPLLALGKGFIFSFCSCAPCARHLFFYFMFAQPAQDYFSPKTSLRDVRKPFFD